MAVPREARTVNIHELELQAFAPPEARVRVACSKGTYVRTLCADIGAALGCGACLKALVRTRIGGVCLDEARTLDEVMALSADDLAALLMPPGVGDDEGCAGD
ncbi:MAG: hypothetical protein NT045_03485 [Candidatus Aureabacteria bacterium]|nr:hypothetical protein [Candidatus Auribacterota bacterium]